MTETQQDEPAKTVALDEDDSQADERGLSNAVRAVRAGAVVVATAAAAYEAWHEIRDRDVSRADLPDSEVRIEWLIDLATENDILDSIEEDLRKEWGEFGLLGFKSAREMARKAGRNVFVALHRDEAGKLRPEAIVQTTLADLHGDPELLKERFPTFDDLISADAWKHARGDTAVLLQITVLGSEQRGVGLGSVLRNTALNMLGRDVRYVLTATPVDLKPGQDGLDLSQPRSYTPAMKFHLRGGAEPTIILPAYKVGELPTSHGTDVVVMRYVRNEAGEWPSPRPEMRTRSVGPLQERLTLTAKRVKVLSGHGRRALSRLAHRRFRRGS